MRLLPLANLMEALMIETYLIGLVGQSLERIRQPRQIVPLLSEIVGIDRS